MKTEELRTRFQHLMQQRTGALAVLSNNGWPYLAMTPFAINPETAQFIVHISTLAAHTRYLLQRPQAAFMVSMAERAEAPVHALPRVSFQVEGYSPERGSQAWEAARVCYFERFPDSAFMAEFTDFHLFTLNIVRTRQITGFGAAKTLPLEDIQRWMKTTR